jgi:hypothetical protein
MQLANCRGDRPPAAGGCGRVACVRTTPQAARTGNHQAGFVISLFSGSSDTSSGTAQAGFPGQFPAPRLAAPKPGLSLDLEDQRNAHASACLDFMVAIDKALLQAPCQLPADCRLARTHHAHAVNVVAGLHAGILSGGLAPVKRKGRLGRPSNFICFRLSSVSASLRFSAL